MTTGILESSNPFLQLNPVRDLSLNGINGRRTKGIDSNMVLGMGIDIVKISRVEDLLVKWKDRFLNRLFTEREIAFCINKRLPSQHFAIRFAAKEAFLKALGLGMLAGIPWKDIEIINDTMGKPSIELHSKAKGIGINKNIRNVLLSMSHDGGFGIAQVILEG